MGVQSVNLSFSNTFNGTLKGPKGSVKVGSNEGELAPYDMLYGALASCLYATFLGIAEKKRIAFESVDFVVSGEKREEVPTILKWIRVRMIIKGAEKEKGLIQSAELAAKYCSIYHTLGQIADMKLEVEFVA